MNTVIPSMNTQMWCALFEQATCEHILFYTNSYSADTRTNYLEKCAYQKIADIY